MNKLKVVRQGLMGLALAFGLIAIAGCLSEIDFASSDAIDESIAIQGKIVKGNPSFVSVTIRGVFNFKDVPRLLNAREVTIEDEGGNKLELTTTQDGVFFLEIPNDHPTFKVAYGQSYRVNVSTFDNRNYSSGFDQLYPAPEPESLRVERTQIEIIDRNGQAELFDQLTYYLSTPLKPTGSNINARILWEMISTFQYTDTPEAYSARACRPTRIDNESKTCYITSAPINNYISLNGPEFSMDRVDNFELLSTSLNSDYAEGFYLSVLQQSLSPGAYDYWSQVGEVVQRTGDLFQTPAGRVITNFTNVDNPREGVFGYFYATEEKIRRVFVEPSLAGNPPLYCPSPPSQSGQAANDCCNCLTAGSQSTTRRPTWWQ